MSDYTGAALSAASANALRDSEGLTDWLSGECTRAPTVGWCRVLRDKTAEDFASTSVPALVALAFDAGQRHAVRCAAMDALSARYCSQPAVKAAIEDGADDIARQMADDARAELRECCHH
ncbi:hypothetical protein [Roseateles sp. BYS96W]|uniref:HEAT repeat domain-containing protein n=1 Tax=Pelomonas nitida TaxID=3299027 RepID=A0ABW7G7D2_9BURK